MASKNDIKIELATPLHRDGILFLAEKVFIKGEPVRVSLNVTWEQAKLGWEKMVDDCLQHPHSHVAISSCGNVIGFRLSRIISLDNYSKNESINEFIPPGHVRTIEDRLTKNWAHALVDSAGNTSKKLLQFLALSVHPDYGGQGLAEKMCKENMILGRQLGCEYCSVVASNWMSQRVFEKLGFTTMASILFEDLKDENGQRPFEINDPKQKGSKWQIKKL